MNAQRYVQLHKELFEAFCDRHGYSGMLAAQGFVMWLRIHSGIYKPMCQEYMSMLDELKHICAR